ncbi:Small glutamine-rich tetratricopeptide repeat-containing protein beta [Grifola frondosa]|uniref:Small glutamine-rich tetratricopeptide repeat-containing protein beta n=1 Tax=Grifola frondosa TaxID=5627 RepID=A0A1C7MS11_GRIFR|nr:Small glutamine-rich tetratricopeptide repeat-containing protein beta [Grifola frondosa]
MRMFGNCRKRGLATDSRMPDNPKDKAAQLKAEGNALFVQREYALAYHKYGDTIECDGENAILYANRAACSLAMRKYLDAASDASKATKLDPDYPKAWARLATAQAGLQEIENSIESWKKALAALPVMNLNDKKQEEAKKESASVPFPLIPSINLNQMPWSRALAMIPEAIQSGQGGRTSAWVIGGAYNDFAKGVEMMKQLQEHPLSGTRGPKVLVGKLGAIAEITNGIMRDERVFHMPESDWITKYNKQMEFECAKWKAWTEGGVQAVIDGAQERLRNGGWNDVRPAIATTVRAYIMRAFLESGLRSNHQLSSELYGRVVEILEWGRRAWKDVSRDDRGVVFEDSFLRGVRSMRLEVQMMGYAQDPGPNSKFPLADLLEDAQDMIREMETATDDQPTDCDPGFLMSFWLYPKGRAAAMIGFYHAQMASQCIKDGEEDEVIRDHFVKAAASYVDAATTYPPDDENHVWFLHCALQAMYSCGAPVTVFLSTVKRLRLAIPDMNKIWEFSVNSPMHLHENAIQRDLELEKVIQEKLEKGEYTLDSIIAPQPER